MNHLVSIGEYDDYRIIGIVVCDNLSDSMPFLITKFFNDKNHNLSYYPQAYNMLTGKGWTWEDFDGFDGDRCGLADSFAKWLVDESGMPTIEYEELSFGGV